MKIEDLKKYSKQIIIAAVIIIACIILAVLKPSRDTLLSMTSPEMQKMIDADVNSTRKRVTITYNSMLIINYVSLSTSGANVMNERYVGFLGNVYSADAGAMKIVGQMVNYSYRMLGCGENLMHGAKLTILLTPLTVIFGVLLGTLLALGKISKKKILAKLSGAYIFFFRGTPLLIQIFVVYFTVPGSPGEISSAHLMRKPCIRERLLLRLSLLP